MKITKELLEHLKVKSISLKDGGKNTFCFLERVEKGTLTFSLPQRISFDGEKTEFEVTFGGVHAFDRDESCPFTATVKESGEDFVSVEIDEPNDFSRVDAFLKIISRMEEKYETFGRRKEERVKIGKERRSEFGLQKLEQSIFVQGVKTVQPCVVLDASVHGICVITTATPQIRNEENFCIKLSFENPEQTVILKAHKVYSRLTKTESKTFVSFSCQLLEPIHFAWKERVIDMINRSADLQ